jgi:hypothetical protein
MGGIISDEGLEFVEWKRTPLSLEKRYVVIL